MAMTGAAPQADQGPGPGPVPERRGIRRAHLGFRLHARKFLHVNREKTCPLLIRVFTKNGEHHTEEDYAIRGKVPKTEVQIYTWLDATLMELTELVKEVAPEARRRDARLSFAFVYPDPLGRNVIRKVGITHANGSRRGGNDNVNLHDLHFEIGDFLDVAIL